MRTTPDVATSSPVAEREWYFLEVSGDIVERVDPVFFSDPMTAAMKALGMT
jgi:ATP-dependent Lon protease